MGRQDDIIRASEIGQYVFCARAWWLGRVKGYRSINQAAMRKGTDHHQGHGRSVTVYRLLQGLAVALILLAVLVLVAWLLLSLGR
jgi:hypothetical protein